MLDRKRSCSQESPLDTCLEQGLQGESFGACLETVIDIFIYTKELEITPIIFQCIAENTNLFIGKVEDIGAVIAELIYKSETGKICLQDYTQRAKRKRLIHKLKELFEKLALSTQYTPFNKLSMQKYMSFWASMANYLKNQGQPILEAYFKRKEALYQRRKLDLEKEVNLYSTINFTRKYVKKMGTCSKNSAKSYSQACSLEKDPAKQTSIFFTNGQLNPEVQPFAPSENWHVLYDLCLAQYYEMLCGLSQGLPEEVALKKSNAQKLIFTQYMSYYKKFFMKNLK